MAVEMQQQFFELLKNSLPPNVSLADELVERLGLSHDSVYRRIRGDKPLNMGEIKTLCKHYKISLDEVMDLTSDAIVFHAPGINVEHMPFLDYIKAMLQQVTYFNSFKDKNIRYLCKDMIFFHFFLYPEMSAFKTFFWVKTIQNNAAYSKKLFSLKDHDFDECHTIGKLIIRQYNEVPSVELWNAESINSTLSQIEYYRDSKMFASHEDFIHVLESFERTLDHLENQAEKGVKFMPGDEPTAYKAPLQFYINEVVLGNNTILAELDGTRHSFITYNVLNYMVTKDLRFSSRAFASFDTLVSRSTLISSTGEKERSRFFFRYKERIAALKNYSAS
jgi:hypothetical protein